MLKIKMFAIITHEAFNFFQKIVADQLSRIIPLRILKTKELTFKQVPYKFEEKKNYLVHE